MLDFILYAARDTKTGKLVSDLTNPRRKFWQRRGDCENAIRKANRWRSQYKFELVILNVTELKE